MQEIVEELLSLSEDVPVELAEPEFEHLVEVQEIILLPIPAELREFLLGCGTVVYGDLEPVTIADPQSHTYLPDVTSQAWDLGLPRDLVPLCEHSGGYFCVDQGDEVRFWQDGDFTDEQWQNVWYWVRDFWMPRG